MAKYVVSDNPRTSWNGRYYNYRFRSTDGSPRAQDEVERRRRNRQPAYLWRWDSGVATLVERHPAQ